jgi:hypothetical protein
MSVEAGVGAAGVRRSRDHRSVYRLVPRLPLRSMCHDVASSRREGASGPRLHR